MRTLSTHNLVIDGYPDLDENGGSKGLADVHCVGSFINHSSANNNVKFKVIDYQSPHLIYRLEAPMRSIILHATRKIFEHEQLLVSYESVHFADLSVEIPFM